MKSVKKNIALAVTGLSIAAVASMASASTSTPAVNLKVFSNLGNRIQLTVSDQSDGHGHIAPKSIQCTGSSCNGQLGAFTNKMVNPDQAHYAHAVDQWPSTFTLNVKSAGGANPGSSTNVSNYSLNSSDIQKLLGNSPSVSGINSGASSLIIIGDTYAKDMKSAESQCTRYLNLNPVNSQPLILCYSQSGNNPWN